MRAGRVAAAAAALSASKPCLAERRCLALPDRSADDLGYAISVVCDPAKFDCGPIQPSADSASPYWPNTINAHCNWAFDGYWKAKGGGNESFCTSGGSTGVPAGKAKVYDCPEECSKCRLRAGTTDQAAYDVIGYLCNSSPAILGPLCAAINPGGALANASAQERAGYVADLFYQPLACSHGAAACDFGGKGEVAACPTPAPQPCAGCAGFMDAACLQANYTLFSGCNCGGGGCDCSLCCPGEATRECAATAAGVRAAPPASCAGGCGTPAPGYCCCAACTATGTTPGQPCSEVANGTASYGCSSGCSSYCCCP